MAAPSGPGSPALEPPSTASHTGGYPDALYRWNILCVTVCLSITSLVFGLRCYVRICVKKQWILEDWFVTVAWLGLVVFCALSTETLRRHGGVHESELTESQIQDVIYWFSAGTIEYNPAILSAKLAILLLYRRVFMVQKKGVLDWSTKVLMVVLCLFYLAITLVKIWACVPRERIWNKSIPGQCVDVGTLLNTSGLFNTITDFIILLIPVKVAWVLQMSTKRKVAVVLVFTLGLTAPVFSTIGFVVRIKISRNPDSTYYQPEIPLWATAEVSSCLICVCVPTLAPLIRRRHPTRPSVSTTNNQSSQFRKFSSIRDPALAGADEEDLVGLRAPESGHATTTADSPMAVMTGIKGGTANFRQVEKELEMHNLNLRGQMGEAVTTNGILTTVELEQTYV